MNDVQTMTDVNEMQTKGDELSAMLGREHVRVEGGTIRVAPADTGEVAAVLRWANERGVPVGIYGGGTKQDWSEPVTSKLALSMLRLNAVREHTWQDMTCTVDAGCSWSAMQEKLAEHGQFVALNPLWPETATVGGIVSANDSGSLRHRYGSLRDLVIGMTIVLADGTVAKSGGKVVKNVAGYDLHKLMTGAFGTLGVMTEITFRLHSIPRHTQSLSVAADEAEPLGRLLLQILDSHLSTQAIQLRCDRAGFHLDVEIVALPEVIREQTGALGALAGKLDLDVTEGSEEMWRTRQRLFRGDGLVSGNAPGNATDNAPDNAPDSRPGNVVASAPGDVVVKGTMLPSAIARFSAEVRSSGGCAVTQAVGTMIASIPVSGVPQLRQRLEAEHGSLTILQQPLGSTLSRWGTPPDMLPLMREIKQRFDPGHILNRGQFLGGM